MKYSQFRRWLENLGIELSKGKGSHWMARLTGNDQTPAIRGLRPDIGNRKGQCRQQAHNKKAAGQPATKKESFQGRAPLEQREKMQNYRTFTEA